MVSGGFRPTAPQNKFGVSATGGNGSKDGQPVRLAAGGAWGSRTAMATQQGGAAMKNSEDTQVPDLPPITSLTAPTERPNEPITAGVNIGAGAGSEALNLGQTYLKLSDSLEQMLAYDATGEIAVLYQEALSQGN